MISDERISKPMDIPKKRKYYQDLIYSRDLATELVNITLKLGQGMAGMALENFRRYVTMYIQTVATLKATKTAWRIEPCKSNHEKLKDVNPCGNVRVAKNILTSMGSEDIDEGEMADTEDLNETTWRRHQSTRHKNSA
ncbi:hypothetical protein BOTNAR_0130g00280 [Botryotinia narcissicola]|uniref:Uncharacterized protein n=1 Tax=Botryotinia narcissicola TaxID=278944 RepID=A0A4Z1IIZ4_9HELO|nr:hypothetical protein BOTNAR_0130g00280 [Botryotinia narcissicola]